MAGEGFGYDYGMTPGFPNADRMDDDRFDSNSTPPLAMDVELDESQGNATASSRSEEIQGYIQNIESIYHQGLQAVYPIPQHEQSAYPLPALIDPPQDQLYAYVDEHTDEQTYEHGSQSMGTLAQPLGNWTVPFLHVNGQSPQHEYANNPQGGTHDPGIAFQSSSPGFDPPMMGVVPAGVPSQIAYTATPGMRYGSSPNPANPHMYQQAQSQQDQYWQNQGQYQQGQAQQGYCEHNQYPQGQAHQEQWQQSQYHHQYQQDLGQSAQTQPTPSAWPHIPSQAPPFPTQPSATPPPQTLGLPFRPRIASQASYSSNPNAYHGPQPGTSPSTYESYGQHVSRALRSSVSLGTRTISNTTLVSLSTDAGQSVNANLSVPLNSNDSTSAGAPTWPGQPSAAVNTRGQLAYRAALQARVSQGQSGSAGPSTTKKEKGRRKGPLTPKQKEDSQNRKRNFSICARCKWRSVGCDLGDDGNQRCTRCTTGRSNTCICTRHHFLHLIEEGGATQFTEHHCIHELVPYQDLEHCTISEICSYVREYTNTGFTHIKLCRIGMQTQSECTFDLKACLDLFRHVGFAFAQSLTFREFMDHAVLRDTIRARLQMCIPMLNENCFNLGPLIDHEGGPAGAFFQFQLFRNSSECSTSAGNHLNKLGAVLFLTFGRQIEFEIFSALSTNLRQAQKAPKDSTIWGLNYLQESLSRMRLAFRKHARTATGARPDLNQGRLRELCLHLANVHFYKQEWAAKNWPHDAPATLFPQGLTEASFEAWMASP